MAFIESIPPLQVDLKDWHGTQRPARRFPEKPLPNDIYSICNSSGNLFLITSLMSATKNDVGATTSAANQAAESQTGENESGRISRRNSSTGRFQVTSPTSANDAKARALSKPSAPMGDEDLEQSLSPSGMKATSAPVFPLHATQKSAFGKIAALGRPAIRIFKTGSDKKKESRAVRFNQGDESDEMLPNSTANDMDSIFTAANAKSWRHVETLEHPPIMDFYRNSIQGEGGMMPSRPSMLELLHGEKKDIDEFNDFMGKNMNIVVQMDMSEMDLSRPPPNAIRSVPSPSPQTQARSKFGWIEGVFFRCFLNIVGTMLYLRVSWVAAQAGILVGTIVVLLASVVTTITALSTCAICTNGDVKGGGAYFLISRSLGPEFGGAIGLMFAVANAVGAAMCITGFAETVRDLLREFSIQIIDGGTNDVRVIGILTCAVLIGIIFVGTDFESKMQMGLLVILLLSLVDYYLGTFMTSDEEQLRRGLTGYSVATLKENFLPAFRHGYNFFAVFSIYFPATTGIMAGANISGDLADPQRAIPLGTLIAIFVTTIIYVGTVWTTGSTCVRDADGINPPMLMSAQNDSIMLALTRPELADSSQDLYTPSAFPSYVVPDCAYNSTCPYGLMNFFQVMELSSLWGPLIIAGIFAATLSSALASLVSAPKIFQAVCKDGLFPYIGYFEKGYGRNEEPRRAYVLAFIISLLMCLIGDLNLIAPIISNFYLCAYALINYACFDNSFVHSPGFRPGFRYYNMWVSLLGAILCVSVMFIISWFMALVTFFFFALLFFYISRRKPDVNWGSSTQAHSYRTAIQGVTKLDHTDEHVKNYRPQILVLTGHPATRPSLVDFFYNITKGKSLMTCGYVVPYAASNSVFVTIGQLNESVREWLKRRSVKSFFDCVANPSLRFGAQSMMQLSGLGKLRPNILALGFKRNWVSKGMDGLAELNEYFGIIQDAFDNNMGVAILRNGSSGFDYSDAMIGGQDSSASLLDSTRISERNCNMIPATTREGTTGFGKLRAASDLPEKIASMANEAARHPNEQPPLTILNEYLEGEQDNENEPNDEKQRLAPNGTSQDNLKVNKNGKSAENTNSISDGGDSDRNGAEKEMLSTLNRFQQKVKDPIIDVWWLYDDGGLALLIPFLLSQPKSYLENANLRVYTISTSVSGMEQEQRNMAALLSKFRIGFSDVKVIPDIAREPRRETLDEFANLVRPFRMKTSEGEEWNGEEGQITDAELSAQRSKTKRQLRIAELLRQHSTDADLIVLSLPVPRKGLVSSALYMSWLEMMTRNLPPVLLVRGNQSSVLTFYS